jgi:ATP-dependent DNA ligase
MLLTPGAVPDGDAWALELKSDGCRAQLRYHGLPVSVRTVGGRNCAAKLSELVQLAGVLGKRRATLGELVCLDPAGRPDFAWLRRRLAGASRDQRLAMLQVFDVLRPDGWAKRIDSRYLSGRHRPALSKHKLRRSEQLAVTGIRRTREG